MDDLISRQAALEALRGYLVGKRCPDDGTLTCRLIENEVINKLPSAQPEQLEQCPIYGGMCAYPSDQCYDCPRHAERRWR